MNDDVSNDDSQRNEIMDDIITDIRDGLELAYAIHDKVRPPVCSEFQCAWLVWPTLFPESARPDKSGMIFANRFTWRNAKHFACVMRGRYSKHAPDNKLLLNRLTQRGHMVKVEWIGMLNGIPTIHHEYYWDEKRYPSMTRKHLKRIFEESLSKKDKATQTAHSPLLTRFFDGQV